MIFHISKQLRPLCIQNIQELFFRAIILLEIKIQKKFQGLCKHPVDEHYYEYSVAYLDEHLYEQSFSFSFSSSVQTTHLNSNSSMPWFGPVFRYLPLLTLINDRRKVHQGGEI